MNYYTRIALLSLSLGAAAQAAPFMAIGDGAELFVTGTLGVRVDDNIFLSGTGEIDDVIFDINPGWDLAFGKNSQLQGSFSGSLDFANYTDNDNLNTTLLQTDLVSRYDDGKMKLNFNAGFHELNQNSVDIRGLTRRDVFNAGGNGEVEVSALTAIGAGVAFTHENYKRTGYTDSDDLLVPLNLYYKMSPKVDLSLGYRFRDHQVDVGGDDSNDHFFNIGARGEFTPKLTGRVAVGWNRRSLDRGGDEDGFGLDASLSFAATPNTDVQFGASNDFGTSPQGQQQENFTINGMVTTKLSAEWTANFGLSYRAIEYKSTATAASRTDDFFEGTLGTAYVINSNVRIVGSYAHRSYTSALPGSDFKNNVFSIAAHFRY